MQYFKKKCNFQCKITKLYHDHRTICILAAVLLVILTICFMWDHVCTGKDRNLRDKFGHNRSRRKKRARTSSGDENERTLSEKEKYRRRMKYGNEANRNNLEHMRPRSKHRASEDKWRVNCLLEMMYLYTLLHMEQMKSKLSTWNDVFCIHCWTWITIGKCTYRDGT